MSDCIFCQIVNNDLPSQKIFENNEVVAFLDIQPVQFGHALVVSKKHYDTFEQTPVAEIINLFTIVHKLAAAIKASVKANGFNITINNGRAAGQVVDHLHIHIIPRFNNDGLSSWDKLTYQDGQMKELAEQIKNSVN